MYRKTPEDIKYKSQPNLLGPLFRVTAYLWVGMAVLLTILRAKGM